MTNSAQGSITVRRRPKNGDNGTPGSSGKAGISDRQTEWASGIYYRNDLDLDLPARYLDIVTVTNVAGGITSPLGVKFDLYQAKEAHNGVISSADNKPGTGSSWGMYWQKMNELKPIYTPFLLARLISAKEIDVDSLVAKILKTANSGPRIEISGSIMEIFGNALNPNIRIGVNSSGMAILTYFDNNGKQLYDLGPAGISFYNDIVNAYWTATAKIVRVAPITYDPNHVPNPEGDPAVSLIPEWADLLSAPSGYTSLDDINANVGAIYHVYNDGRGDPVKTYDRTNEGYLFTAENFTSAKIADGWYSFATSSPFEYESDNTNTLIKPDVDGIYQYTNGVYDQTHIYQRGIVEYIGGMPTGRSFNVFWNA